MMNNNKYINREVIVIFCFACEAIWRLCRLCTCALDKTVQFVTSESRGRTGIGTTDVKRQTVKRIHPPVLFDCAQYFLPAFVKAVTI
jgi:hypothetical protein